MRPAARLGDLVIAVTPVGRPDARLAAAAGHLERPPRGPSARYLREHP